MVNHDDVTQNILKVFGYEVTTSNTLITAYNGFVTYSLTTPG